MKDTYTDPLLSATKGNKSYTSQLISSALMGAAIGAAVMIATDPQKRQTTVQKAKHAADKLRDGYNAMKNKEQKMVNDTTDSLITDDTTTL